jgi:hypothetical protein
LGDDLELVVCVADDVADQADAVGGGAREASLAVAAASDAAGAREAFATAMERVLEALRATAKAGRRRHQ